MGDREENGEEKASALEAFVITFVLVFVSVLIGMYEQGYDFGNFMSTGFPFVTILSVFLAGVTTLIVACQALIIAPKK